MTLKAGSTIKITTNDEFKEKCTAECIWLDYKTITKVTVGKLFILRLVLIGGNTWQETVH